MADFLATTRPSLSRELLSMEDSGLIELNGSEIDNKIVTAPCEGTVLPGVTRDSILHILKDWGYEIEERHLSVDELMEAGHNGKLQEAWGTGTAAVISPIGELYYKGDKVTVSDFKTGELTQKLYDTLTGIQWGTIADPYGWTVVVD